MNDVLKERIEEIRKKRVGDLIAMELDIYFLDQQITKSNEEDLRDQLEKLDIELKAEQCKLVKDDDNKVKEDTRDLDRIMDLNKEISVLNIKIDKIETYKSKRDLYDDSKVDLTKYLELIEILPGELIEKMKVWAERK